MDHIRFSILEILSLIGLTQCVYVLVYMLFRAGDIKRAFLPFSYFFVLATAFFFDFAQSYIGSSFAAYVLIQELAWFLGPPLSVLLTIQIARINKMPDFSNFWVLLLIPAAFIIAVLMVRHDESCSLYLLNCRAGQEWLAIAGLLAGGISMLALWKHHTALDQLHKEKAGKDRYWLILTLIAVNLFFLSAVLLEVSGAITGPQTLMIRTFLGLAIIYLAGSSLFRIYPQALPLIARTDHKENLSADNQALVNKIENLLDLDKVYHEPAYGRVELARELGVSEAAVSKMVNQHFGKTVPQLLNERRVQDAQRLLVETQASIKVIAQEVGFNAVASFNRVFRDITGMTPSDYRAGQKEAISKKNANL